MFSNYLKLSFRLLVRSPFFSTINVVGLAIGFASFYALWEYSTSELRADQYHQDANRTARIGVNWRWTDDGGKSWGHLIFGFASSSLIPKINEDFPELESTLRILPQRAFRQKTLNHGDRINISVQDQNGGQRVFKEEKVVYADSNLFTFFSIPMIYGQPQDVLNEPNFVAVSSSTALRYFGKRDPRGELLKLNDSITLKVSGVFEDLSHYTHLNFDFVISNKGFLNKWNNAVFEAATCYIKLSNSDFKTFETKLNERKDIYWADVLRNDPQVNLDMFVQPLEEIAFSENFVGDTFYPKSKPFLFTLAFIALSVLVMAWVNYVNLSVARTSRRFNEIATRKVSGAAASDMIAQFMMEALVTNLFALALSITLIQIIRSSVYDLFDIQIADFSSLSLTSAVVLISIISSGILLSGLYPAFISMAYQPRALFNMNSRVSAKRFIPSILTISQLVAAIIFILLGFTISLQLNHILSIDTGIDKDQVIVVDGPVVKPKNYSAILSSLKNEIANDTEVLSITNSRFLVNSVHGGGLDSRRVGSGLFFGMDDNYVDEDFISFYGLKLLAGRKFIKDDRHDAIIISRWAATRLGFDSPEEAIGSKINVRVAVTDWKDAEVIGVIENFRNTSFLNMNQSNTEAHTGRGIVLFYGDKLFEGSDLSPEKISIRVSPQKFEKTIATIETLLKREFPSMVFAWYFLDDKLNEVYAHEKVARNQVVLFTGLALVIACLGLLGMITNKAVEKTREIGIRKVLGAQFRDIALTLLGTTAKQIILATFIGLPAAYFLMKLYLEKFSERIELQWWHFTTPIVILLLLMFVTIASVLWKTARANPVQALKYE